MAVLPAQPHIDHLRRQARDLLRAARAGDAAAVAGMGAVSDRMTLAAAQLAVARDYGFASWAKLKADVEARTAELARLADEFCVASIRDWTGRAVRMLAARPELADYNLATAVLLGDAEKFRRAVEGDPSLATAPDPRTGWTALHAACASRWHKLDPARARGLLAIARLALDAGADPNGFGGGRAGDWTPLRCAVAGEPNPEITRLLLDRGAVPDDSALYLAGFEDDHQCMRALTERRDVREIARMALAAPISGNDVEGVRMLLEAGADPGRYQNDDGEPYPIVYAAVRSDCSAELIELLLTHGADPERPGPDGRSPHSLAIRKGRTDVAALLRRHGASDDATDIDRFLAACLHGDRSDAERQLASQPGFLDQLTSAQQAEAMIRAAETGNTEAMRIMLDVGFGAHAQGGDNGATALHEAAHAGSDGVVRLLLARGADVEARDGRWDSTALVWGVIGSSEKPTGNPHPDWPATVRALLQAGASVDGITLSPDDDHQPSPAVAELLRQYGVRDEQHRDEQR